MSRSKVHPGAIHAELPPVRAWAVYLAKLKAKRYHVVTIPEGSRAYKHGYRFTTVDDDDELTYYLEHGATLVESK